jgi:hypothetical protein
MRHSGARAMGEHKTRARFVRTDEKRRDRTRFSGLKRQLLRAIGFHSADCPRKVGVLASNLADIDLVPNVFWQFERVQRLDGFACHVAPERTP